MVTNLYRGLIPKQNQGQEWLPASEILEESIDRFINDNGLQKDSKRNSPRLFIKAICAQSVALGISADHRHTALNAMCAIAIQPDSNWRDAFTQTSNSMNQEFGAGVPISSYIP